MSSPTPSDSELQPPEIPVIFYEPSLQLQRQKKVHEILRSVSETPRFEGKLTRLLDVGCGDASFVRRLTPCEDRLPLELMTGIDVDDDHANGMSWEILRPGPRDSERWRPLNIKLLHGSFENLSLTNVGYHDAVVSVEGMRSSKLYSDIIQLTMLQCLNILTLLRTPSSLRSCWVA
jgi:hypothetical protein